MPTSTEGIFALNDMQDAHTCVCVFVCTALYMFARVYVSTPFLQGAEWKPEGAYTLTFTDGICARSKRHPRFHLHGADKQTRVSLLHSSKANLDGGCTYAVIIEGG